MEELQRRGELREVEEKKIAPPFSPKKSICDLILLSNSPENY